jgi:hypothetical protein
MDLNKFRSLIGADLQAQAGLDDIGIDAILIMPDGFTQSPAGWPVISEFAAIFLINDSRRNVHLFGRFGCLNIGRALPRWMRPMVIARQDLDHWRL